MNEKKATTRVTIIDCKLQIGDTVTLFILRRGILTMVKGKIQDLESEKKIATISYEGELYFRPFKQVERI